MEDFINTAAMLLIPFWAFYFSHINCNITIALIALSVVLIKSPLDFGKVDNSDDKRKFEMELLLGL